MFLSVSSGFISKFHLSLLFFFNFSLCISYIYLVNAVGFKREVQLAP